MSYTFTLELPSGRTLVMEGEAPADATTVDLAYLDFLSEARFSAKGYPGARSQVWKDLEAPPPAPPAKKAES